MKNKPDVSIGALPENSTDVQKSAYADLFPEQEELARRWPVAQRELASLLKRIRDIKKANPQPLYTGITDKDKLAFMESLFESLYEHSFPGIKSRVARKMADKIGRYLLWRREASTPVIHELLILLPWWMGNMPGEASRAIREIGLKYILNGRVLPLDRVLTDIMTSRFVYLGHCACRSSGVVDDLKKDGKVFTILPEKDKNLLLNRIMDTYENLAKRHGEIPETDEKYKTIFNQLLKYRREDPEKYKLETLLEKTYAEWEILPVHENYTPVWIRSMHKNHKAHLIHKELVFEFALIQYLARGTIFTSMKLIDSPYTICSCPTPENDGGCVLTNWYYWGDSNESLLPNIQEYCGQRKSDTGDVLPCRFFPVRKSRECLGCGCIHGHESPRGLFPVLKRADRIFEEHTKKKPVSQDKS